MDWRKLTKAEKLKFYKQCKELYYTTGESPIEDFEFDELQAELGYENKDTTPVKHNPKYTVQHPVKMGSLSKVQIKKTNSNIDWEYFYKEVSKYIYKNSKNPNVIITPKYDGCSFETVINFNKIVSISGRGDGEYGANYMNQLLSKVFNAVKDLPFENCILRGEVLVDKTIFLNKYSVLADPDNGYVNPRSWVAGLLGRDYDGANEEYLKMLNDISIIIYDVKLQNENGEYIDKDWTILSEYIDKKYLPSKYFITDLNNANDFEKIYNEMNNFRINECSFALDGFVIKPIEQNRKYNVNDYRPKDCVAIKFIPQLQETEVIDISWKLGEKSKCYVPTIIVNAVEMDGKRITRAAASNYGKLIYDKISVGTKLILSLAGDIIPFIYKITDTSQFDESKLCIPDTYETYVEEGGIRADGNPTLNLKAILSENDRKKLDFIVSAKVLNIPNLGGALTTVLWDYINRPVDVNDPTDDFFGIVKSNTIKEIPDNILYCDIMDIQLGIGGKNGEKISKSFKKICNDITLKEIIQSCNFKGCGEKVAEQCANYLTDSEYDFSHLSKEGYEWCLSNTDKLQKIKKIVSHFGKQLSDYKVIKTEEQIAFENEQIPVILTGEPNDYASKGEFIKLHPEYRVTGKWSEVKIVFTNSLDSNTGKMKKAKEKGIEIRLY